MGKEQRHGYHVWMSLSFESRSSVFLISIAMGTGGLEKVHVVDIPFCCLFGYDWEGWWAHGMVAVADRCYFISGTVITHITSLQKQLDTITIILISFYHFANVRNEVRIESSHCCRTVRPSAPIPAQAGNCDHHSSQTLPVPSLPWRLHSTHPLLPKRIFVGYRVFDSAHYVTAQKMMNRGLPSHRPSHAGSRRRERVCRQPRRLDASNAARHQCRCL